MASPDFIELAMRTPLPKSTSTIYLSTSGSSLTEERRVSDGLNHSASDVISEAHFRNTNQEEAGSSQIDDGDPNLPRLNESSLPPMDKGFGAWSYLMAAFLVESIVWGFPVAFGVFLDDYLNDPVYASQPNAPFLLPLIGPISMGIMYCSSPILNPLLVIRYPHYRRIAMRFGAIICAASLFGASYAKSVPQLLALQGVAYSIGGALLYHPTLSYLPAWFFTRRGLANGVVFAGTAVGGVFLPLILPSLLQRYGSRVTLRYIGVAVGVGLIPGMIWIKPRVPERARARPHSRAALERWHGSSRHPLVNRVKENIKGRLSWWLSHRAFAILLLANTAQGFGYFMPLIWLPTYASSLNLDKTESALVLSLLNAGSVVGRLGLGFLSDKLDPWVLAVGTLVSTMLSVFILWGVCSFNLAGLLVFGLAYGVSAGGWGTLWTGFIRGNINDRARTSERASGPDDPRLVSTLFGYLMLSRGIGSIFSTPISSVLQPSSSGQGSVSLTEVAINNTTSLAFQIAPAEVISSLHASTGFSVANHRFQNLIIYVGTCFAAASVVMLIGWGWEKWRLNYQQNARTGREREERRTILIDEA